MIGLKPSVYCCGSFIRTLSESGEEWKVKVFAPNTDSGADANFTKLHQFIEVIAPVRGFEVSRRSAKPHAVSLCQGSVSGGQLNRAQNRR